MEDAQLVRHRYSYDSETGEWLWLNPPPRAPKSKAAPGQMAGTYDKRDGSRQLNLDGRIYPAARLAWLYAYGEWPVAQVCYEDPALPTPARDRLSNIKLAGSEVELTAERLRKLLAYDAAEGIFRWLVSRKGTKAGSVAGGLRKTNDGTFHSYVRIDRVDYTAQRLAWLYVYGEWPSHRLIFKNDRPADFRIENLVESEYEHQTRQTPKIGADERKIRLARTMRRHDLKRDFGIDEDAYDAMLEAQGGVCAICRQPETEMRDGKVKNLAVDHNHKTDVIRELLCAACNISIGKMKEDPSRLRAAALYLERHVAADEEVAA